MKHEHHCTESFKGPGEWDTVPRHMAGHLGVAGMASEYGELFSVRRIAWTSKSHDGLLKYPGLVIAQICDWNAAHEERNLTESCGRKDKRG